VRFKQGNEEEASTPALNLDGWFQNLFETNQHTPEHNAGNTNLFSATQQPPYATADMLALNMINSETGSV